MPSKEYMKEWRIKRYIKGLCAECNSPCFEQRTRCIRHCRLNAKHTAEWKKRHANSRDIQEVPENHNVKEA